MTTKATSLTIAILGYGNVARALCRLIADRQERIRGLGAALRITAVAGRTRGVAECLGGFDPRSLASGGDDIPFRPWRRGEDGVSFAGSAAGEVLVELTSLDVRSGQPAVAHVETALKAAKHVVTANKGPAAWDYARLAEIARHRRRAFLFEAAVMDGVPLFSLVRRCLAACRVEGVRGVLNSTTNYVLDRMGEGRGFDEALAEAQAMGIAEADPSLDLDGWDSAAKLAVLANVLIGGRVTPLTIERRGIRDVRPADVRAARSRGCAIRLVCEARRVDPGPGLLETGEARHGCEVRAVVEPRDVPEGGPLGQVRGTSSVLTIFTDLLGSITLSEESPLLPQTAYGVLADLLEIVKLKREGRG